MDQPLALSRPPYIPQVNTDYQSKNGGTRSIAYTASFYYQEQVDVIPDWLSIVGGWAYIQTETVSGHQYCL